MDLRDRIDELEKLLGIDDNYVHQLRVALQLGTIPCLALGYISKKIFASNESLFIVLYGTRKECEKPGINMVTNTVWRVRQRLIPLGIVMENQQSTGYSMTPANKRKLHDFVDSHMATLAA
jgi:hypothetical protein